MKVPSMIDTIADVIVEKIMADLSDRSGILDGIDNNTLEEIRETMYDIVVKEIL